MKRYDSYKDSGVKCLGEIPSHWEVCRFKNIASLITTPSSDKRKVGLENIESGCGRFLQTDNQFEGNGVQFEVEDVVYGKLRPYLKKVWIASFSGNAVGDFFVFRPDKRINNRYLFYLMLSDSFTDDINSSTYGAKMPRVSSEYILTLGCAVPLITEQEAIANYLDAVTSKIDDAIAQQQKMIDLLNERKQIIINNAVTKGLNPNVKMKPSGIDWIGDIPVHWEVKKIKYIANVKGRIGFKGYSASDLVEEGAYSLGGKHITNNIVDLTEPTFLSWKKYYESPEIMIKKGDIVTAQRGSLGHTAIIEEDIGPATINPSLVLITNIKCYNKYLYWYLLSYPILKTIEVLNTATAVPMLSQKQIENMTIAMPSYKEQELISAYLEKETKKIEVSKDNINKQISLLQERKQIIINDVVTGKVKVI